MEINILRVLATTASIVFFALSFALSVGFLYYWFPLPDWIFLVIELAVIVWVGEFNERLIYRKKGIFWGTVKSRRDKLVVACALAVTWTFIALPLRLGIASGWVKFLMIVTGGILGYTIWRCFGSPDITRPDRSRSGADDG